MSLPGKTKKTIVKDRIKRSVSASKADVFLTGDFLKFGSRAAVGAALKKLVEENFLVRISVGIYAKTEWNPYAGGRLVSTALGDLAPAAMERKGRPLKLGRLSRDYAEGRITQIPAINIYEIGNRRISRKFNLYGSTIYYERKGKMIGSLL